jgi:N-acetylglutamate synthase-like GNAT family acetyltransferase
VFRKAESRDIDVIHQLLLAEAAQGRFDRRLVDEPYRSGLRKNLNHIRKRGRRLDEDVRAQLLVWESDAGAATGCIINSAISTDAGNELWMVAVFPEYRGQGQGREMNGEVLSFLHPRVDVFARCATEAQVYFQMNLRSGFLPLDTTDQGVRVMKLPKLGSVLSTQGNLHQQLEPFVEIPVR